MKAKKWLDRVLHPKKHIAAEVGALEKAARELRAEMARGWLEDNEDRLAVVMMDRAVSALVSVRKMYDEGETRPGASRG
jgi:hypothetical protein